MPNVAAKAITASDLGLCECVNGVGVHPPVETARFTHDFVHRWEIRGLSAYLNGKGFDTPDGIACVWDTASPTNTWISDDLTRTCASAIADIYQLQIHEDGDEWYKVMLGLKPGETLACDDEIDWVFVAKFRWPAPDKTVELTWYDMEGKTSADGDYVDPPSTVCTVCMVPQAAGTVPFSCTHAGGTENFDLPQTIYLNAARAPQAGFTGLVTVPKNGGGNIKIYREEFDRILADLWASPPTGEWEEANDRWGYDLSPWYGRTYTVDIYNASTDASEGTLDLEVYATTGAGTYVNRATCFCGGISSLCYYPVGEPLAHYFGIQHGPINFSLRWSTGAQSHVTTVSVKTENAHGCPADLSRITVDEDQSNWSFSIITLVFGVFLGSTFVDTGNSISLASV